RVVGSGKEMTVIGVVGDVLNTSLNQALVPAMYYPASQRLWPAGMDVVVRTQGNPERAMAGARQGLRGVDPEVAAANVETMEQWISSSAAQRRLNASLVAVFAGCALVLGAIGIYGVLSLSVGQRRREIGVRMALGAERARVVRQVFREGMTVAAAGIVLGSVA